MFHEIVKSNTILEKAEAVEDKLIIIKNNGFMLDMNPSFISITYKIDVLFKSSRADVPVEMVEL